jgi:hypothetical protein
MPLVPQMSDGQVRLVLTWGRHPVEMFLKVKTPEGTLKTPLYRGGGGGGGGRGGGGGGGDMPKVDDEEEGDHDQGEENTLANIEFECGLTERTSGFGPISVLIKTLQPGRYHVYAHARSCTVDQQEVIPVCVCVCMCVCVCIARVRAIHTHTHTRYTHTHTHTGRVAGEHRAAHRVR